MASLEAGASLASDLDTLLERELLQVAGECRKLLGDP